MRVALVHRAIDIASLLAEVSDASCGAACVFVGSVRDVNDGRAVTGIDYSAYESMAEREMAAIAREADEQFGVSRLVVEHRLGHLGLGDVSIAIVAGHAHRMAALDATRFVIEQVKQRVPIWKREHYVDGTREWVGAGTGSESAEQGTEVPINSTEASAR